MDRAIVLIGVRRSGGLPVLQAVETGLDAMRAWASAQGIPDGLVVECSDRDGQPVTAAAITSIITDLVARPSLAQLVVYFAGHGVNNGQSEYWLLSGAPDNPNEAVNVAGSAMLAERHPVPHVVLISDACRTAPAGIQALGVTGSVIFPNVAPMGPASTVDQFYACLLGSPANEIADKDEAARVYRSLYTEVLVEALRGDHRDLLEPASATDPQDLTGAFVRPWPLKRGLPGLAMARLKATGAYLTVNQQPDARVTSDPQVAWVSRVETGSPAGGGDDAGDGAGDGAGEDVGGVPGRGGGPTRGGGPGVVPPRGPGSPDGEQDLGSRVAREVADVLDGRDPARRGRRHRPSRDFTDRTAALRSDFGPRSFESGVGVKVRGARVVDAYAWGGQPEPLGEDLVRIWPTTGGGREGEVAGTALVVVDEGAVVVPTLHGFLVGVTVEDGQVVDVAWEPMAGTQRAGEWEDPDGRFRPLRAQLATAAAFGVDPVADDRTDQVRDWVLDALRLDPSVAVYGAWLLRDRGRPDDVVAVRDRVVAEFGFTVADLELLVGAEVPGDAAPPGLPLLSRGWATFDVVADPHPSPGLAAGRVPSIWTMYHADQVPALVAMMDAADALPRRVPALLADP